MMLVLSSRDTFLGFHFFLDFFFSSGFAVLFGSVFIENSPKLWKNIFGFSNYAKYQ